VPIAVTICLQGQSPVASREHTGHGGGAALVDDDLLAVGQIDGASD
jgi:hypothetical protein